MEARERLMFLLGSGISKNLPRVQQLTESVLSAPWLEDGTARVSLPNDTNTWRISSDPARSDQNFLRIIHDAIIRQDSDLDHIQSPVTYEDLYYWCYALLYQERLPQLADFVGQMINAAPQDQIPWDNRENHFSLLSFVSGVMYFIRNVIFENLKKEYAPEGLDLFADLVRNDYALDIATLNHDIQLEQYFDNTGIAYIDGFMANPEGLRVYQSLSPTALDTPSNAPKPIVRVIKPHGSINWFTDADQRQIVRTISPRAVWPRYRAGIDGPAIICGTGNKDNEYNDLIVFADMWCWFHRWLTEHHTIVVSGYGFGDRAVNSQLWSWLNWNARNKLVLLYQPSDKIWTKLKEDGWLKRFESQLIRHDQYLEDTTLEKLKTLLEQSQAT